MFHGCREDNWGNYVLKNHFWKYMSTPNSVTIHQTLIVWLLIKYVLNISCHISYIIKWLKQIIKTLIYFLTGEMPLVTSVNDTFTNCKGPALSLCCGSRYTLLDKTSIPTFQWKILPITNVKLVIQRNKFDVHITTGLWSIFPWK